MVGAEPLSLQLPKINTSSSSSDAIVPSSIVSWREARTRLFAGWDALRFPWPEGDPNGCYSVRVVISVYECIQVAKSCLRRPGFADLSDAGKLGVLRFWERQVAFVRTHYMLQEDGLIPYESGCRAYWSPRDDSSCSARLSKQFLSSTAFQSTLLEAFSAVDCLNGGQCPAPRCPSRPMDAQDIEELVFVGSDKVIGFMQLCLFARLYHPRVKVESELSSRLLLAKKMVVWVKDLFDGGGHRHHMRGRTLDNHTEKEVRVRCEMTLSIFLSLGKLVRNGTGKAGGHEETESETDSSTVFELFAEFVEEWKSQLNGPNSNNGSGLLGVSSVNALKEIVSEHRTQLVHLRKSEGKRLTQFLVTLCSVFEDGSRRYRELEEGKPFNPKTPVERCGKLLAVLAGGRDGGGTIDQQQAFPFDVTDVNLIRELLLRPLAEEMNFQYLLQLTAIDCGWRAALHSGGFFWSASEFLLQSLVGLGDVELISRMAAVVQGSGFFGHYAKHSEFAKLLGVFSDFDDLMTIGDKARSRSVFLALVEFLEMAMRKPGADNYRWSITIEQCFSVCAAIGTAAADGCVSAGSRKYALSIVDMVAWVRCLRQDEAINIAAILWHAAYSQEEGAGAVDPTRLAELIHEDSFWLPSELKFSGTGAIEVKGRYAYSDLTFEIECFRSLYAKVRKWQHFQTDQGSLSRMLESLYCRRFSSFDGEEEERSRSSPSQDWSPKCLDVALEILDVMRERDDIVKDIAFCFLQHARERRELEEVLNRLRSSELQAVGKWTTHLDLRWERHPYDSHGDKKEDAAEVCLEILRRLGSIAESAQSDLEFEIFASNYCYISVSARAGTRPSSTGRLMSWSFDLDDDKLSMAREVWKIVERRFGSIGDALRRELFHAQARPKFDLERFRENVGNGISSLAELEDISHDQEMISGASEKLRWFLDFRRWAVAEGVLESTMTDASRGGHSMIRQNSGFWVFAEHFKEIKAEHRLEVWEFWRKSCFFRCASFRRRDSDVFRGAGFGSTSTAPPPESPEEYKKRERMILELFCADIFRSGDVLDVIRFWSAFHCSNDNPHEMPSFLKQTEDSAREGIAVVREIVRVLGRFHVLDDVVNRSLHMVSKQYQRNKRVRESDAVEIPQHESDDAHADPEGTGFLKNVVFVIRKRQGKGGGREDQCGCSISQRDSTWICIEATVAAISRLGSKLESLGLIAGNGKLRLGRLLRDIILPFEFVSRSLPPRGQSAATVDETVANRDLLLELFPRSSYGNSFMSLLYGLYEQYPAERFEPAMRIVVSDAIGDDRLRNLLDLDIIKVDTLRLLVEDADLREFLGMSVSFGSTSMHHNDLCLHDVVQSPVDRIVRVREWVQQMCCGQSQRFAYAERIFIPRLSLSYVLRPYFHSASFFGQLLSLESIGKLQDFESFITAWPTQFGFASPMAMFARSDVGWSASVARAQTAEPGTGDVVGVGQDQEDDGASIFWFFASDAKFLFFPDEGGDDFREALGEHLRRLAKLDPGTELPPYYTRLLGCERSKPAERVARTFLMLERLFREFGHGFVDHLVRAFHVDSMRAWYVRFDSAQVLFLGEDRTQARNLLESMFELSDDEYSFCSPFDMGDDAIRNIGVEGANLLEAIASTFFVRMVYVKACSSHNDFGDSHFHRWAAVFFPSLLPLQEPPFEGCRGLCRVEVVQSNKSRVRGYMGEDKNSCDFANLGYAIRQDLNRLSDADRREIIADPELFERFTRIVRLYDRRPHYCGQDEDSGRQKLDAPVDIAEVHRIRWWRFFQKRHLWHARFRMAEVWYSWLVSLSNSPPGPSTSNHYSSCGDREDRWETEADKFSESVGKLFEKVADDNTLMEILVSLIEEDSWQRKKEGFQPEVVEDVSIAKAQYQGEDVVVDDVSEEGEGPEANCSSQEGVAWLASVFAELPILTTTSLFSPPALSSMPSLDASRVRAKRRSIAKNLIELSKTIDKSPQGMKLDFFLGANMTDKTGPGLLENTLDRLEVMARAAKEAMATSPSLFDGIYFWSRNTNPIWRDDPQRALTSFPAKIVSVMTELTKATEGPLPQTCYDAALSVLCNLILFESDELLLANHVQAFIKYRMDSPIDCRAQFVSWRTSLQPAAYRTEIVRLAACAERTRNFDAADLLLSFVMEEVRNLRSSDASANTVSSGAVHGADGDCVLAVMDAPCTARMAIACWRCGPCTDRAGRCPEHGQYETVCVVLHALTHIGPMSGSRNAEFLQFAQEVLSEECEEPWPKSLTQRCVCLALASTAWFMGKEKSGCFLLGRVVAELKAVLKASWHVRCSPDSEGEGGRPSEIPKRNDHSLGVTLSCDCEQDGAPHWESVLRAMDILFLVEWSAETEGLLLSLGGCELLSHSQFLLRPSQEHRLVDMLYSQAFSAQAFNCVREWREYLPRVIPQAVTVPEHSRPFLYADFLMFAGTPWANRDTPHWCSLREQANAFLVVKDEGELPSFPAFGEVLKECDEKFFEKHAASCGALAPTNSHVRPLQPADLPSVARAVASHVIGIDVNTGRPAVRHFPFPLFLPPNGLVFRGLSARHGDNLAKMSIHDVVQHGVRCVDWRHSAQQGQTWARAGQFFASPQLDHAGLFASIDGPFRAFVAIRSEYANRVISHAGRGRWACEGSIHAVFYDPVPLCAISFVVATRYCFPDCNVGDAQVPVFFPDETDDATMIHENLKNKAVQVAKSMGRDILSEDEIIYNETMRVYAGMAKAGESRRGFSGEAVADVEMVD